MIGSTLQQILKEKGINVNELATLIEVSPQTLYSIIKRDNMKIDFEVLIKICTALDVNVERFYIDYIKRPISSNAILLTEDEKQILNNYRTLDDIDKAEIRGEIKQMLKADKYHNNITNILSIAAENQYSAHADDDLDDIEHT